MMETLYRILFRTKSNPFVLEESTYTKGTEGVKINVANILMEYEKLNNCGTEYFIMENE